MDIEQPDQLLTWLHLHHHIADWEHPDITKLPGGVSSRCILIHREPPHPDWVMKQSLEKLRVEVDWFSDPERIHREAAGIRTLGQLLPAGTVPALYFEDHEEHLLAMAAVPRPHENWKSLLLSGIVSRSHVKQFAQLLNLIHSEAAKKSNTLALAFRDSANFESLRLAPYFTYTADQVPGARGFIKDLVQQTRKRQLTLVHGDYSPKNILIYNERLVLLDHEVIHWGDPAFDVGFALAHLLSKAHHLFPQRKVFRDAAKYFWRIYKNDNNVETEDRKRMQSEQSGREVSRAGPDHNEQYDNAQPGSDPVPNEHQESRDEQMHHVQAGSEQWRQDLELFAVRHSLACLLARVAGKSPLEYLTEKEREVQRVIVTDMMDHCPDTIDTLIDSFVDRLDKNS